MMFNDALGLAISQPAHAWASGQMMRAWADPLTEPVLMAAEQHDIGWLDWETAPSFDPATGRPHLFRHVPARVHAPMWAKGVARALTAWGPHVALLVSRHGSVIYTRFTDRARQSPEDAAATEHYLTTQAAFQQRWAAELGLTPADLATQTGLVAFADTLSLALCGELRVPLTLEAPGQGGEMRPIRLECTQPGTAFTLAPWPFAPPSLALEIEAWPLPPGGRFGSAAEMQDWHQTAGRAPLRVTLTPGAEQALDPAPIRGVPPP